MWTINRFVQAGPSRDEAVYERVVRDGMYSKSTGRSCTTRPQHYDVMIPQVLIEMKGGEGWDVFEVHWKELHAPQHYDVMIPQPLIE